MEKCTRTDTRPIDACKRARVQIETIGHNICDAFIYILFPARQMIGFTENTQWRMKCKFQCKNVRTVNEENRRKKRNSQYKFELQL